MTIPNKHPQEIEVWYVLPAIRKELVVALKEKGFSQKKIANYLNVTEPAISQYTKQKRAKEINLCDDVKNFIRKASEEITDNKSAFQQIQKISRFIKSSKAMCQIHMQLESHLKKCDVCYK
ncbi:MAG: hypothetical protein ABH824_02945 [Nanoarchaeota archaeon]|nr:hypothetical protein [Nanoarchaeota archaeon]MBU1632067.1 hypothetical protein [Nanoarchaeota archaeon]MBU1875701.1 hypothetical protein [Nanoarchaeota archaeon]